MKYLTNLKLKPN